MSKLSLAAALLLCLLAVLSANIFTVTATVTEDDIDNQGSQRCHDQIQRQRLNHCRMYLSGNRQYYGDELSKVTDEESNQGQEHL
nr:2S sulfur-rich seed storage protein 2-like [Nicotiana tomentosiformis]